MKKVWLLLLIVVFLSGCTWFTQDINVLVSPSSGHPSDDGLRVRIYGYLAPADIDFGDGTALKVYEDSVYHLYTQAGEYTITVSHKGSVGEATVEVTNLPPEVYPPAISAGDYGYGERITICMDYRISGSCYSTYAYGARDRDDDSLEFRYTVRCMDTGKYDSIYNSSREPIAGDWVSDTKVTWFAGWQGAVPPYPFVPYQLMCASDQLEYLLTIDVRDPWGGQTTITKTIQINP
jgi:hypothetical protein